jgi:hypothetical protein
MAKYFVPIQTLYTFQVAVKSICTNGFIHPSFLYSKFVDFFVNMLESYISMNYLSLDVEQWIIML